MAQPYRPGSRRPPGSLPTLLLPSTAVTSYLAPRSSEGHGSPTVTAIETPPPIRSGPPTVGRPPTPPPMPRPPSPPVSARPLPLPRTPRIRTAEVLVAFWAFFVVVVGMWIVEGGVRD